MSGRRASALAFVVVSALTPAAMATPCSQQHAESGAPARLMFGPGGHGSLPEACPATDSALQGFASVLIAVDDFYGGLEAGLAARFRRRISDDAWISVFLPPLQYRFGANATIEADRFGIGAASVGYHHRLRLTARVQLTPYVRALYPSDTGYDEALLYGVEHGLAGVAELDPSLELVFGAAFPAWFVVNHQHVHTTYAPALELQAVFTPKPWFAAVLGAGVRFRAGDGNAGARFESFDPRAALRVYPIGGLRIELAAAVPVWGHDRTDVLIGLNAGWIFDR